MDTLEDQIKAIEAANTHEAEQMEPGEGEQQEDAGDTEQEQDDTDAGEESSDEPEQEDAEDDDTDEETDEKDDEQPKRRSKPAKQRIAELTAKLREAERKLEAATTEPQGKDKEPEKPNPADFEYGEADPKFIDAMQDYKLDVRDADRKKADSEQARVRAMHDRINTGIAKAEAEAQDKYEDFDARIAEAVANRGGSPLPPLLTIGIGVSPAGGDIMYRLATDDATSDRLEGLANGGNPRALAMALGELEGEYLEDTTDADLDTSDDMDMARMLGRMRARVAGRKADAPKPKVIPETKAPEPPKQRARGGGGKRETPVDTDDMKAFMARYGKDLGR